LTENDSGLNNQTGSLTKLISLVYTTPES
jgi:hypothetical protein